MIRIGLIDGALPLDWPGLKDQRWFCSGDGAPVAQTHAEAMAAMVSGYCREVEFHNAVVFPGRLGTSVEAVCGAFHWFAETQPDIVLCSFGTARTSLDLGLRIARLLVNGSLVVASAPARGEKVYPAALPGVVSVQGDARCAPGEFSRLDLPHADFGACPEIPRYPGIRGASAAAAHIVGQLAVARSQNGHAGTDSLLAAVRYHGRECKGRDHQRRAD